MFSNKNWGQVFFGGEIAISLRLLGRHSACEEVHWISVILDNLSFIKCRIMYNYIPVQLTDFKDLKPTGVNTGVRRLRDLGIVVKEANLLCLLPTIFTTDTGDCYVCSWSWLHQIPVLVFFLLSKVERCSLLCKPNNWLSWF